jgi:3-isopropylmalate/(R)-2-methylmalate dehydratase large subunit
VLRGDGETSIGTNESRYIANFYAALDDGSNVAGISHAMMAEHYALPGQLVVGTDSHTPHSGALGCVAFGVGTTDMANAFVTGAVRLTVPESLRIELDGRLPAGLTAKDVVLHLLALPAIRGGAGVGKVFEFAGPVLRALATDARATLTNMTAELGGFTGIVEPDAETVRFLRERRGVAFEIEAWMRSDPGARYADVIRVDCSALTPMVARPGDPGNGVALADLGERVPVDIAYGGSCTAGKRDDLDMYAEVMAEARTAGRRVAPGVRFYIQFGSEDVARYAQTRGYLDVFRDTGVEVISPGCGACIGCGPGVSDRPDQVTVSAINRNYKGRSGPGRLYLASPLTVAASAVVGHIAAWKKGMFRREPARASR